MQGQGLDRAEELALALAALDKAAGEGAALVSFSMDTGVPARGSDKLSAAARMTRETRTLLFLEADVADADGRLTMALSAVYRRA